MLRRPSYPTIELVSSSFLRVRGAGDEYVSPLRHINLISKHNELHMQPSPNHSSRASQLAIPTTEPIRLADASSPYRGLGGWVQKQADIFHVAFLVPDYFLKRCPGSVRPEEAEGLLKLKNTFREAFTRITAKGATIVDQDERGNLISLLEQAKKWVGLRMSHFAGLLDVAENFDITLTPTAQLAAYYNKDDFRSARELCGRLETLSKALRAG